jgi:hypothetical protein
MELDINIQSVRARSVLNTPVSEVKRTKLVIMPNTVVGNTKIGKINYKFLSL